MRQLGSLYQKFKKLPPLHQIGVGAGVFVVLLLMKSVFSGGTPDVVAPEMSKTAEQTENLVSRTKPRVLIIVQDFTSSLSKAETQQVLQNLTKAVSAVKDPHIVKVIMVGAEAVTTGTAWDESSRKSLIRDLQHTTRMAINPLRSNFLDALSKAANEAEFRRSLGQDVEVIVLGDGINHSPDASGNRTIDFTPEASIDSLKNEDAKKLDALETRWANLLKGGMDKITFIKVGRDTAHTAKGQFDIAEALARRNVAVSRTVDSWKSKIEEEIISQFQQSETVITWYDADGNQLTGDFFDIGVPDIANPTAVGPFTLRLTGGPNKVPVTFSSTDMSFVPSTGHITTRVSINRGEPKNIGDTFMLEGTVVNQEKGNHYFETSVVFYVQQSDQSEFPIWSAVNKPYEFTVSSAGKVGVNQNGRSPRPRIQQSSGWYRYIFPLFVLVLSGAGFNQYRRYNIRKAKEEEAKKVAAEAAAEEERLKAQKALADEYAKLKEDCEHVTFGTRNVIRGRIQESSQGVAEQGTLNAFLDENLEADLKYMCLGSTLGEASELRERIQQSGLNTDAKDRIRKALHEEVESWMKNECLTSTMDEIASWPEKIKSSGLNEKAQGRITEALNEQLERLLTDICKNASPNIGEIEADMGTRLNTQIEQSGLDVDAQKRVKAVLAERVDALRENREAEEAQLAKQIEEARTARPERRRRGAGTEEKQPDAILGTVSLNAERIPLMLTSVPLGTAGTIYQRGDKSVVLETTEPGYVFEHTDDIGVVQSEPIIPNTPRVLDHNGDIVLPDGTRAAIVLQTISQNTTTTAPTGGGRRRKRRERRSN